MIAEAAQDDAEAGQSSDEVVLGVVRPLMSVDTAVRRLEAVAGHRGGAVGGDRSGSDQAGVVGSGEDERERWCPVVEAGAWADADAVGGGLSQLPLCCGPVAGFQVQEGEADGAVGQGLSRWSGCHGVCRRWVRAMVRASRRQCRSEAGSTPIMRAWCRCSRSARTWSRSRPSGSAWRR